MIKLLIVLFLSVLSFDLFSESYSLKVQIKNGTNNTHGKVDKLKLIELNQGMKILHELVNVSGNVEFPILEINDQLPLLIQAEYKNNNYNKLLPPVKEFRKKQIEVIIYETTNSKKILDVKSVIQITKEKTYFTIHKIFLIKNISSPPKTFDAKNNPISIFIPNNSVNIQVGLNQNDSKMTIPLSLDENNLFTRGIIPGTSELQVSYQIPYSNNELIETIPDKISFPQSNQVRYAFFKPNDMKVSFENTLNIIPIKEEISDSMTGFEITYPTSEIFIKLEGGTPVVPKNVSTKLDIINGKLFYNTERSIAGIIGVIGILFLFQIFFQFVFASKK